MQISSIKTNTQSFNGFMNSKTLVKGLEMAGDNGALFAAGTAFVLSTLIRPIAIMSTPKVEKEDKQYACAKAISSSLVNLGLMTLITTPVVSAVKNIQENPEKFLKNETIKMFNGKNKNLSSSASFSFATQFFKLSSGLLTVIPKTFLTCALIPPIVAFFFNNKSSKNQKNNKISFRGISPKPSFNSKIKEKLSKCFAKVLNSKKVQDISNKYKDTNLAQHLFSVNDILATGLFINYTSKNNNISKDNQKSLIYNAAISTGLTVAGGYALNEILKKPTQLFIDKFRQVNKTLPSLNKCVEGIKNAKAALILGGMYYVLTPVLATFWAGSIIKRDKGNING